LLFGELKLDWHSLPTPLLSIYCLLSLLFFGFFCFCAFAERKKNVLNICTAAAKATEQFLINHCVCV